MYYKIRARIHTWYCTCTTRRLGLEIYGAQNVFYTFLCTCCRPISSPPLHPPTTPSPVWMLNHTSSLSYHHRPPPNHTRSFLRVEARTWFSAETRTFFLLNNKHDTTVEIYLYLYFEPFIVFIRLLSCTL